MPTLKSATNKLTMKDKLAKLQSLGSAKIEYNKVDMLTDIQNILTTFVDNIITKMQSSNQMVIRTGAIENITIETNKNIVQVTAPPHFYYQSEGVDGKGAGSFQGSTHEPPFKFKKAKKHKGIIAKNFFTKEELNKLEEDITRAIADEIN